MHLYCCPPLPSPALTHTQPAAIPLRPASPLQTLMKRTKHGDEGDIDRRLEAGILRSAKYKQADFDAGGWVRCGAVRWGGLGGLSLAGPGRADSQAVLCWACSVLGRSTEQRNERGQEPRQLPLPARLPPMPALL